MPESYERDIEKMSNDDLINQLIADEIETDCWNTMADNCVKYLDKGSSISFEGDYETTQYKKDNVTVTNVKVVKATIEFTDRKPQTEQ